MADGIVEADMILHGEIIVGFEPWGTPLQSGDIDAQGLFVMAGMIDPHVHMRDPGQADKDDFVSGTAAAAIGGVTTVFDMPNTVPAVSTSAILTSKAEYLQSRSLIDFALYGGAGASNLDTIVEQADAGAVAFKSFMNAPAPSAGPDGLTRCLPDDYVFLLAMKRIAQTGRIGVLHAENDVLCKSLAASLRAQGRNDPAAHGESRPNFAEEEAVSRAILLAREADARISFAHISTSGALERIRHAKRQGWRVTAEACPHHLLLNEEVLLKVGPYGKINPPLRSESDRAAVWAALLDGTIDFIGTDHAPYLVSEKDPGWSDIWQAPSGVHGIESALTVLITEVVCGRLTLPQLTRLVSGNVAQLFGLAPRKGALIEGADADFVLIDLSQRGNVDRNVMQSKSRDAAQLWDGRETRGGIAATYVRGREVARNGVVTAEPGYGRFIRPERVSK
nr:dihydroorotase family protein [Aminobacter anthyllidis]